MSGVATDGEVEAGQQNGNSKGAAMTGEDEERREPSIGAPATASGADQAGVRLYNERLVLSLVRRYQQLSKVEVARLTGLSVQTASAIMNRLQVDGLLLREAPQRGRVGQPTVPLSLDAEGAFSFGLKIGRRSCELVLVDFKGRIRSRAQKTFPYPIPRTILDFVATSLPQAAGALSPGQTRRIAGLGVAAPFQLWNWGAEIGAPPGRWTSGARSTSSAKSPRSAGSR